MPLLRVATSRSPSGSSCRRLGATGRWHLQRFEVFACHKARVAMFAVDLVIEPLHGPGVDLAGQGIQGVRQLGMAPERLGSRQWDGLVGREIAAIVFEDDE